MIVVYIFMTCWAFVGRFRTTVLERLSLEATQQILSTEKISSSAFNFLPTTDQRGII